MKYDHAFSIGFSIVSDHPQGEDVTADMITYALVMRLANLRENDELIEAVGAPFDTFEKE